MNIKKHIIKDLAIIIIFLAGLISLKYIENIKVNKIINKSENAKIQYEKEHFWGINK